MKKNFRLLRALLGALLLFGCLTGCLKIEVDTTRHTTQEETLPPLTSAPETQSAVTEPLVTETAEPTEPPVADCFALHCVELQPTSFEGFDFAYESQYAMLLVRFEEKDDPSLRLSGVDSLSAYAEYRAAQDAPGSTLQADAQGLPFFTYTVDGGDGQYHYYVALRESDGCFWSFRYLCDDASWAEYQNLFADWAGRIEMGASDGA